jgi:biopolymer transport protein ExbD
MTSAQASAARHPSLGGSVIKRQPMGEDAHFDITAMVDLVFMMNIFFLVTWVTAAMNEIDLPPATHCVATDPDTCVTITMLLNAGGGVEVFLGDAKSPRVSDTAIEDTVRDAVTDGLDQGKTTVLVKAAKEVQLRDLSRVAAAAAGIEGMKLHLAVIEKE